jgi:WXG100 family type VII secretion target
MTTPFTVTPQDLQTAATNCLTANQTLQEQIAQVQTLINGLIDSGYQGPCASQLVSVASSWNTDAVNLNTALSDIAANLTTSANNYSGTENQNTINVSSVGDALLSPGNF